MQKETFNKDLKLFVKKIKIYSKAKKKIFIKKKMNKKFQRSFIIDFSVSG